MPRKPPTPIDHGFDLAVVADDDIIHVADILGIVAGAVIDALADHVGGEIAVGLDDRRWSAEGAAGCVVSAGAGAGAAVSCGIGGGRDKRRQRRA